MARAANGGRLTCESCEAIDVREWKRRGFLRQRVPILWTACYLGGRRPWFRCTAYSNGQYCRPGQMFPVSWNCSGDVPCGSIPVRTESDVAPNARAQDPSHAGACRSHPAGTAAGAGPRRKSGSRRHPRA
jgi:hypothetical protein